MTNEEIVELYNKLVEHFGDNLANPEHQPRTFEYQVRLYRYYNERKQNENSSSQ